MRKKITKSAVDALQPANGRPVFLWDTKVTGFGCKVTSAGRKVYIFQYRTRDQATNTPKRITLGKHGQLTADQARAHAANLLLQVKAGNDPAAAWRKRDAPTVALLAYRFLAEYLPGKKRPPRPSTITFYEILFRRHVLPRLGNKPVDAVTSNDLERLHTAMSDTPYVANRTLSLLQNAFDVAEKWQWRPQKSNPALHLDRYPEQRRGAKKEVMLTPKQMAKLLKAVDAEEESSRDPIACAAIRFTFWTGWRIGEVLRLEWANIDLDNGRAKLLHTKSSTEEYRSLPAEAFQILQSIPRLANCRYVFPGRKAGSHLTTVRKHWARIRARADLHQLDGLGAFRLHDLRHNVVSWDVSRGVPLEIAGRNVGHRSRKSTEVYAHFAPDALRQAADERAEAMRAALEKAG